MKNLTVQNAIKTGLDHSSGNARHIYRNEKAADQFFKYLKLKHPQVRYFKQITPGHLRGYVQWLLDRDISPTTARNYLNPIRLASRTIEENSPDQWNQLFFRRIVPSPRIPPKRHLTADRLIDCINLARSHSDHTSVIALVLGGIVGMRLSEIVNFRADDLDVENQTIHIHDSKNVWSHRLIPIPKVACDYLRLFLIFHGWNWKFRCHETMSKALRRTIRRMHKKTGDETYQMIGPKDCCRKTAWNVMLSHDCKLEYMRAFLGHAPTTVAERHYLDIRPVPDDLPDYRTRKIEMLRKEIVEPMERALRELKM